MIFHYKSNTYIKIVVQQREDDFLDESGPSLAFRVVNTQLAVSPHQRLSEEDVLALSVQV